MARPPRTTVKLSQERKVRSLAKKTLGSTRTGRAMRLPVIGGIVSLRRGGWKERGLYPALSGGVVGLTCSLLGRMVWVTSRAVQAVLVVCRPPRHWSYKGKAIFDGRC